MDIMYKQLEFELGEPNMNPKRNKSNRPRSKADFYETPHEMAKAVIEKLFNENFVGRIYDVLDPGCGNGVWTDELIGYLERNELNSDVDFYGIDITVPNHNKFLYTEFVLGDYLNYDFLTDFDLIIGNPPFSLMERFVRKSFSYLRKHGVVALLGRLEFLGSQTRGKGLFSKYPPSNVWVSSRRPSWFSTIENRKTTDMMEYAIFIWEKDVLSMPKLDWFTWEYDK